MNSYYLNEPDLKFVRQQVEVSDIHRIIEESIIQGADRMAGNAKVYKVCFSEDQVDQIVEHLSTSFMKVGLDTNSEPNQIGVYIEGLIDVFQSND